MTGKRIDGGGVFWSCICNDIHALRTVLAMNNGIYMAGTGNKAMMVLPRLPLGMKQGIQLTGSGSRPHELNRDII